MSVRVNNWIEACPFEETISPDGTSIAREVRAPFDLCISSSQNSLTCSLNKVVFTVEDGTKFEVTVAELRAAIDNAMNIAFMRRSRA